MGALQIVVARWHHWEWDTCMASTHKKVIVRKMDRDSMQGYVGTGEFLVGGKLELLNTAGTVVHIELAQIKSICFVRDFADSSVLQRKTFASRPRVEGLWVRLRFSDGETLEALMPNDLTQVRPEGFFLNPPDMRGNVQRIFIPRGALTELTVLAVIGPAMRRRRQAEGAGQTPLLFSELPSE
jgi:Family of unknown function (DUF6982)